jgi:hypothetical protein
VIPILPLILLAVRLSHFGKLTVNDLPSLLEEDLRTMWRSSQVAFIVMLAFSGLSFVPYACLASDAANPWSLGITCLGLLIAAVFDLRAERIKRRGQPTTAKGGNPRTAVEQDPIRWYHIICAVICPYAAAPWGVVNLVRGKRRSGRLLLLIPAALFGSLFVIGVLCEMLSR